MVAYRVKGSAVGHPRTTGATAPSADKSGYRVVGSGVAWPCPDGATMPATVTTGHRIHGRGLWRAPCDETPGSCACGITDLFARTEAGGVGGSGSWGTSDVGIPWTGASGTGTASVSGGKGVLEVTDGFQGIGLRFDTPAFEVQLLITLVGAVSSDPSPNGDGWAISVQKEGGAFANLVLLPDGTLSLYTDAGGSDSTVIADASVPLRVWFRTEDDGSGAKVWVWPDGGFPSGSPTLSHPFNTPGFNYYLNDLNFGVFSDAATVSILVDEVNVDGVNSCLVDDFSRDEEDDWGASTPTGLTYSYPNGVPSIDTAVAAYVDETAGVVEIPDGVMTFAIRLPFYDKWGVDAFIGTYDFLTGAIPGTGESVVIDLFHGAGADPPMDITLAISSDASEGYVQLYAGAVIDSEVKTDWVADTWYRVKFQRKIGAEPLFLAKVWPLTGSEPGSWQLTNSGPFTGSGSPLNSFMQFNLDNFTSGPYTLTFDNIRFTCEIPSC